MDATSYIRFFLALVIVLGMIFALTWVLKRFGIGQNQMGGLGRKKRLRVIESTNLDARHRAVIIRRDNVEHLVVLSPTASTVIEGNIPAPDDEPALENPTFTASFKSLLNPSATKDSATKDNAP